MSNFLKNLFLALGLAFVLFIGYTSYFSNSNDPVLSAKNTGDAERETQEFLVRLKALQSIDIDRTLFEDSRFSSLEDYRVVTAEVSAGRNNPFLPITSTTFTPPDTEAQ